MEQQALPIVQLWKQPELPFTWSIESGSLPAGLTLDASTGEISGTPTTAETANFTVKVANSAGNDTKAFTITITASAVEVAYTAEGDITEIDPYTVTFADGKFTVPEDVTEFTFKDGGKEMKATYRDNTWEIAKVSDDGNSIYNNTGRRSGLYNR